jgi:hypothetical protein
MAVILRETDGEPMPPPAPFNLERWPAPAPPKREPALLPRRVSVDFNKAPWDDDEPVATDFDTRGLYQWQREELDRHLKRKAALENAVQLSGAKLETTYVQWAKAGSAEGGRGKDGAGIFGLVDVNDLHQAIITLSSTGAVLTFLKCAKDVLVAYIKRPSRKITAKIGNKTFTASSVAELDHLIGVIEAREDSHGQLSSRVTSRKNKNLLNNEKPPEK